MHSLAWLEDHMEHCHTMAQWLYEQFTYEFEPLPLEAWQQEFTEGQRSGDWKCLIALEGEQLLGGACLATDDLPGRADLGPWLACVYIDPAARERGLAGALIEEICRHARATGARTLYLHTHDRQAYYAKRGWVTLEPFQAWGKQHWLMSRHLNDQGLR